MTMINLTRKRHMCRDVDLYANVEVGIWVLKGDVGD
jgi:hypothetical protein